MSDPIRICLGCNNPVNIKQLIKLKNVDGKIIINPDYYLDGRSAYLCYNMECINRAKKSKKLERSFKGKVKITEEVWEHLLNEVLMVNAEVIRHLEGK